MIAASLSGGGHPGSNMPGRHKEDDVNLIVAGGEVALPLTNRQGIGNPDVMNYILDGQNSAAVDEMVALHGHQMPMVAGALRASDGHHGHSSPRGDGADNLVIPRGPMGVRRLTPLECERLMGWPDEWTRWTADGHEIPDSHRYRMCGNGVVATVAQWLAHRLVQANAFMERAA